MVKLMDQTLFLHRQQSPARTPQEQTSLSSQIAATDSQIDRLVYDLYGLTGDEIMNGSVSLPHRPSVNNASAPGPLKAMALSAILRLKFTHTASGNRCFGA